MKRLTWIAPLALFAATAARAQDIDKEKLKKEILEEVDKIIRREEEHLLKSVDEFLKEELRRLRGDKEEHPEGGKKKGRGYLGIRPSEVTEDEAEELGLKPDQGAVRIAEVLPDTPAARSGLEVDDVIIEVDGKNVVDIPTLVEMIQEHSPGDTVEFTIIRGKERKKVKVTLMLHPDDVIEKEPREEPPSAKGGAGKEEDLRERVRKFVEKERRARGGEKREEGGENPPEREFGEAFRRMIEQFKKQLEDMGLSAEKVEEMVRQMKEQLERMFRGKDEEPPSRSGKKGEERKENAKPYLGILIEEMSEEESKKAGLPSGRGLAVVEVRPDTPADAAGFKAGDVLVRIDGTDVNGEKTLADFMKGAKPGQKVEFEVIRNGERVKLEVTLGRRE